MDQIQDSVPDMGQPGTSDDATTRAIRVLELVGARRDLTSARQVASLLGAPKSSVHRILQSLQDIGAVQFDEQSRCLRLGPTLMRIGIQALDGLDVRRLARSFLEDLAKRTSETTSLTMRFGDTRSYVDIVDSPHILTARPPLGRPFPLLVGAPGRALAFPLGDEEIEDLLQRTSLRSYTTNTPVSPADVWAGIQRARERGFALAHDEIIPGLATISMPVQNERGDVLGAISIAGPSSRLSVDQLTGFADLLRDVTSSLATELSQLQTT